MNLNDVIAEFFCGCTILHTCMVVNFGTHKDTHCNLERQNLELPLLPSTAVQCDVLQKQRISV